MAGGLAFDPAEFAAFKARGRGGASQMDAPPAAAPAPSGGFDPAEFAAFKARRSAPSDASSGGDPGALSIRVGSSPAPSQ